MERYITLLAVCLGTVISAYLSSCINIALPDIMAELNFNSDSIVWVSLCYLLPYGSMLPLTGKLGDKFGAKRMYIIGLICFSIGSVLCGTASGTNTMMLYRMLQGVGGGILLPNAMSIVAVTFTGSERATALGLWSAMTAIGAAVGPTIGGYLIELFQWRAMFFSIIPICIVATILAIFAIPIHKFNREIPLDITGSILLMVSIGALLVGLNQGEKEGWFHSYYIVSLFYLFFSGFTLFILVELRAESPIVDFSLFKIRNFALANLIAGITFFTLQSTTYLLPFFLKSILNYDSIHAGLMLLPQTLTMVAAASVSGRLNTVFGPRLLTFAGVSATVYAFWLLKDINASFGVHDFFIPLAIYGLGLGLTMSPTTTCAISTLRKNQVGAGSGILNFSKLMCASIGVVVAQVILTQREVYHSEAIKSTLTTSHDPFTLYQYIHGLWQVNLFSGSFDPSAALQLWTEGMQLLPEQYAKFIQILSSSVANQAAIFSFQDDFFILACLSGIGALITLCLQNDR